MAVYDPIASIEPSCAAHTIASTIAFTAAATAIHHRHHDDPYQDHCLFAGITLGVGIGLCLGHGLEGTIFKVLPWAILSALLCNIMMHRLLRKHNSRQTDMENDMRCHIDEKCGGEARGVDGV